MRTGSGRLTNIPFTTALRIVGCFEGTVPLLFEREAEGHEMLDRDFCSPWLRRPFFGSRVIGFALWLEVFNLYR